MLVVCGAVPQKYTRVVARIKTKLCERKKIRKKRKCAVAGTTEPLTGELPLLFSFFLQIFIRFDSLVPVLCHFSFSPNEKCCSLACYTHSILRQCARLAYNALTVESYCVVCCVYVNFVSKRNLLCSFRAFLSRKLK